MIYTERRGLFFKGFRSTLTQRNVPQKLKEAMRVLYGLPAHFEKIVEYKGGVLIQFQVLSSQYFRSGELSHDADLVFSDTFLLDDLRLCFGPWLGNGNGTLGIRLWKVTLNGKKGFECSIHVLPDDLYDLDHLKGYQYPSLTPFEVFRPSSEVY